MAVNAIALVQMPAMIRWLKVVLNQQRKNAHVDSISLAVQIPIALVLHVVP